MAIGKKIGQHIRAGQLIELIGDLGGGKTTLTKGIAAGLGVHKTITSPTFSIQRSYELPKGGMLEHFDLYRLESADTVAQELAECLQDESSIVVIEWTKPFVASLRSDRLVIDLQWKSDNERNIVLRATGPVGKRVLEAVA